MSLKYPYMDDYMNGRITGWKRSIQTALEKNFGMLKMGTLSLSLSLSLSCFMWYVIYLFLSTENCTALLQVFG